MNIKTLIKHIIFNYDVFENHELLKLTKWLNSGDYSDKTLIKSVINSDDFINALLREYNKLSSHIVTVSILDTSVASYLEHEFKFEFDDLDVAVQVKEQLNSRIAFSRDMDENFEISGREFHTNHTIQNVYIESKSPTIYMEIGGKIMFE